MLCIGLLRGRLVLVAKRGLATMDAYNSSVC